MGYFLYNLNMNTRMELWKTYREEINNNIQLQKAVQFSHEKLAILHKRLLEAFPEYDDKYPMEISTFKAKTEELNRAAQFDLEVFENFLNDFAKINEIKSNSFIDKVDFSTHELDEVFKAFKDKKLASKVHVKFDSTEGIVMAPTKFVKLGEENNFTKPLDLSQEEKEEENMKKINIAIDGPSGSGKSTIAKLLADKYKLNYLNTGLVYRAIALNAIEDDVNLNDEEEVMASIQEGMIELLPNEEVILCGANVSKALRADDVSQGASKVSAHTRVRAWAVSLQKEYGKKGGIIMDGRDTTFKILPDAEVRIYLDTSAEVRAQRRVDQNKELGFNIDFDKILSEINERDHRDKNRETDPLHVAPGVEYIDATNMSIEQVLEKASQLVEAKK